MDLINCFAVSDHSCMFAFLAQAERSWGGPSQRGGRERGTLRAPRILSTEGRGGGMNCHFQQGHWGPRGLLQGKKFWVPDLGTIMLSTLHTHTLGSRGPNEDGDPFKVGEVLLRVEVVASAQLHGPWVSSGRFSGEIYTHTLPLSLHNRRVPPSPLKGSVLLQDIPPTRQEFTALTLLSCAPKQLVN